MTSENATRYCRQCLYILNGLPLSRCPECGRAFDADDPSTYRTKLHIVNWRRVAKWGVLVSVILLLIAVVGYGLDYRLSTEICRSCGAYSRVRYVEF